MADEGFMREAEREFRRLQDLAERALAQVDEAAFFRVRGEDGNSLAVLVKHLAGNLRSRWRDFLTSDGEKPDRHRDTEFELDDADSRAALMARWSEAWGILAATLAPLDDGDLLRTVTIRGESHTVRQAVSRQLTHYAYHVGQIVLLARQEVGAAWRSLSVPRGQSQAFNADPQRYLDGKG